jgi:hypothetical protein
MTPQQTLRQITQLTEALVGLSLSNEQNFPTTGGSPSGAFEISVRNAGKMTIALKNVGYRDIYSELADARCFNVKMLDGALVCMRYRFQRARIREHSLAYFPSPDLEHFQNEPELYLEDDIYADVLARNIVPFPIRFDFSDDAKKFVDVHHPYSHLTLGQYENCRIPVFSPIGPLAFGGFVLRNFYNTAFCKYSEKIPVSALSFAKTITANEQKIPHFMCGV